MHRCIAEGRRCRYHMLATPASKAVPSSQSQVPLLEKQQPLSARSVGARCCFGRIGRYYYWTLLPKSWCPSRRQESLEDRERKEANGRTHPPLLDGGSWVALPT